MTSSNKLLTAIRRSFLGLSLAAATCAALLAASDARGDEAPAKTHTEKPVVAITIPSINHTYDDFKLLFGMVRDEKGYQTFTDTLNEFVIGIDPEGPCEVRTYMTAEGMATVYSAPVKDEAAFHKFVKNLWDLDVKTAPPPTPQLQRQIPRSVQEKLHSLKPKLNERLLFGLVNGALLYEKGYVHLSSSLEGVRLAQGEKLTPGEKGSSLNLRIQGDVEPARRHAAFEKSKQDILSRPKREKFDNDADFQLAQAVIDYQLAKIELLVADSAEVQAAYTVARDKKNSHFEAQVTPASGTQLAKDFANLGRRPDRFAGVTRQNAVVTAAVNVPVDVALGKLLKVVAEKAHASTVARIDSSKELDANQVQIDKDLANLVLAITSDVAGMDTFNGFLRAWSDSEGNLTTVGATRVSQIDRIRESLQKFRHRERIQHSIAGAETLKVSNEHWKKDAPELFGTEGSIYIATSDQAVWFALGPQALERLDEAIQATGHEKGSSTGGGKASARPAVEVQADMRPLTQVWDAIWSRRAPRHEVKPVAYTKPKVDSKTATKSEPKSEKADGAKGERKTAVTASAIADLELHKIAADSFKEKDGRFELSLVKEGDKARVAITCDEGILRFAGKVLSEFTKQNLAD
jgi:hypothetical protein